MKIGAGVLLEYLRKLSMYLKIMNSNTNQVYFIWKRPLFSGTIHNNEKNVRKFYEN